MAKLVSVSVQPPAMLTGLNHITLAVSDLDRSFRFYTALPGMQPRARWAQGAYLSLSDLWLCLSLGRSQPADDYTHFAFSVPAGKFDAVCHQLKTAGVELWQPNSSEGDSLYFLDPDGHKLELHAGNLDSRLASIRQDPYDDLVLY